MNLVQKAARWALEKATGSTIPLSLTDPNGWKDVGGGATTSGKPVTSTTAMQQSTVWSCVRVLAETIGAMPVAVYEKQRDGTSKKVDHPVSDVFANSPNSDMTGPEFLEAVTTNLCLGGNEYAYKDTRNDGSLVSLYPLLYTKVTPQRNPETGEITFKVADRGKTEVLPREKIWHVKGFGSNGLVGYSPISYLRQAIGLALAAEEFGGYFFSNGARPSGVVSIPEWLKEEQRKVARESVRQKFASDDGKQGIILLEGGMTFAPVSMPLEDAQFLETRGFQRDEICGIYRVPPHMVGNLARATNNNIEHQSLEFVMFTLMPYFTRIERSATKWLFKPEERNRFYLRFNFEGLLRADAAGRAQFYTQMLQNGVYSRNEVRALENMNRVEGLDDYTVQSNMTLVQLLEQLAAQQVKPEPKKSLSLVR